MKILVSTKETQGARASDFCFVPDGEPVRFGWICDRDAKNPNPDGGCGCGRSLVGMIKGTGTTTFRVIDDPQQTVDGFVSYYLGALQDCGWLNSRSDDDARAAYVADAHELLRLAGAFAVGAVLELRKDRFRQRVLNCAKVAGDKFHTS